MISIRDGLTFDDVLIVPNYNTDIMSRADVCTKARFSRNIEIGLLIGRHKQDWIIIKNPTISL